MLGLNDIKGRIEKTHIILFIIIIVGLVYRFYRINFGLPDLFHQDEPFEMNRALRLASGSFDLTRAGKGGLYYFIFLILGISFIFLKLTGVVNTPDDFAYYFISHESNFYLLARSISSILGILTIYIVYRIGRENGGRFVGLSSAFLIAVSPLNSIHSHYATVDTTLVFLLSLMFLFIFRYLRDNRGKNIILAGIFSGLSIATKLSAVIAIFPIAATFLIGIRHLTRSERRKRYRQFSISFLFFLMVTIAAEPGYLKKAISIGNTVNKYFGSASQENVEKTSVYNPAKPKSVNLYLYYLVIIKKDIGLTVFILFLLSSCYLLLRNILYCFSAAIRTCRTSSNGLIIKGSNVEKIFLSFLIPYYIVMSSTTSILYYPRYVLPIIFIALILAMRGLYEVIKLTDNNNIIKNRYIKQIIGILLTAIIILPSVLQISSLPVEFSSKNPRSNAKQWIHQNIPINTRIMMEGNNEHRSSLLVQIEITDQEYTDMIRNSGERDPGKTKYWQLRQKYLKTLDIPRYKLTLIPIHQRWIGYERFLDSDIKYVIINRERFGNYLKPRQDINAVTRTDFYKNLLKDSRIQLVKTFDYIEIFKKNAELSEL